MTDKTIYRIALTMIKGVGDQTARQLLRTLGDEKAVFTEKKHLLEKIPGIGPYISAEISRPEVMQKAEKEAAFVEKNKISVFFYTDDAYPARLKECEDAPVLFYFKGKANLDATRIISIVGTRHATAYGQNCTEDLVRELRLIFPDTLIVSGLAYGIDITAHRSSLLYGLPTIGVLAHGLDRIYPAAHRNTASRMLENGGLLTDFPSGINPDRPNFVKRNRIVAGLSDATVVIESAEKGGSLITADIAFSYGRDVYSFPGRTHDEQSKGCNTLIRQNKAGLITSAADLVSALCWDTAPVKKQEIPVQTSFLPDLTNEEQQIFDVLKKENGLHINQLSVLFGYPVSRLSSLLFALEMKGVVKNIPGGIYKSIP